MVVGLDSVMDFTRLGFDTRMSYGTVSPMGRFRAECFAAGLAAPHSLGAPGNHADALRHLRPAGIGAPQQSGVPGHAVCICMHALQCRRCMLCHGSPLQLSHVPSLAGAPG